MVDNINSYCEIAFFEFSQTIDNNMIRNINFEVTTCLGDNFKFKSDKVVEYDDKLENYFNVLTDLFWLIKPDFSTNSRLKLTAQTTDYNETALKNKLVSNKSDYIEGIWEGRIGGKKGQKAPKYSLGIIKNNPETYDIIYFSGAPNLDDWISGEKKGTIKKTASSNVYTVQWITSSKGINDNVYCSFDKDGFLIFSFTDKDGNNNSDYKFIKLYPITTSSETKGSATAFALTSEGYVITNYHVVSSGSSLKLVYQQGTSVQRLKLAKVNDDIKNDLSILRIDDPSFKGFGAIPYSLKDKQADVGEEIFVLGFPLIQTMGNELKLTNGLVSSRSGFQGDLTSYQISAPIQRGNSGGPLFDKNGNLTGVVSAKHLETENVSYAIKSSILSNLIESLDIKLRPSSENMLKDMALVDQIKILRNFVFSIEVE